MLLLVALGNPGPRYAPTRHNAGFMLADELGRKYGLNFRQKFNAEYDHFEFHETRIGVLKPQQFMNRSGQSVRACTDFFQLEPKAVLVAHDELDLPLGHLRLKFGGGEAGHNGLRDISQHLGTKDYYRLRLGIGRPPSHFAGTGADFVLQAFAPDETRTVEELLQRAVEAVQAFVTGGPDAAMNEYNRKQ